MSEAKRSEGSANMTTATETTDAALPPVRSEPLLAVVIRERDELRTQLEAWHSVFGTSQLSHAQARLEAAEDAVRRLTANAGAEIGGSMNAEFEKELTHNKACPVGIATGKP